LYGFSRIYAAKANGVFLAFLANFVNAGGWGETGPAHYIHCGGVSEYVEPKNTEKDQKINHEPTPTRTYGTPRTCCPKSWDHEFVVFVRFVVEKIGDKML
jgi:hypothetical protein